MREEIKKSQGKFDDEKAKVQEYAKRILKAIDNLQKKDAEVYRWLMEEIEKLS